MASFKSSKTFVLSKYDTYKLSLCSVSTGDYSNLFIKYKVVDRAIDDKFIVERVNSEERCYNIGEIELVHNGDLVATPIFNKNSDTNGSGYTFKFSGYSKGCGPDKTAESTLVGSFDELEVIELNVKHTFWRSKGSSKGEHWQNQVDSVWFSVPNSFLEKYGKLQRIKAEWYEYFTKDIIVVDDEDRYNKLLEYIANSNTEDLYLSIVEDFGFSLSNATYFCDWIYNQKYTDKTCLSNCEVLDLLYYVFNADDNAISEYDPYSNNLENGGISGNELYDYILNYNKSYNNGSLGIKGGKRISADLFENDIPEERKRSDEYGEIKKGYSCYEFDIDSHLLEWLAFNDIEQKPNITNTFERLMYQFGFKSVEHIDEVGVSGLSPICRRSMCTFPPIIPIYNFCLTTIIRT